MSAPKGLDAEAADIGRLYAAGRTMRQIARLYDISPQSVSALMRRHGIAARPQHYLRQGDNASYRQLHTRVGKIRGKPQHCAECGTTDPAKRYEWANLTGDYADPADYKRMCMSCHRRYDHARWKGPGNLSLTEAARRIGTSHSMVRRLVERGLIAGQKTGDGQSNPYCISEQAIAEYLKRQTVEAAS